MRMKKINQEKRSPNRYLRDNVLMSDLEDVLKLTKLKKEYGKFRMSQLMSKICYVIWINYFGPKITTKQLLKKLKNTQQSSVYRALARLIKLRIVSKMAKRDKWGNTPLRLTQVGFRIFSKNPLFKKAERIRGKAYEKKYNKKFPK